MTASAVRISGLSRAFGDRYVLRGIDLDIRAGEAVAVTGANGSGKTTLLRIIATLLRPTAGQIVHFENPEAPLPSVRVKIGALFTAGYLSDDLTVRENLEFFVRLHGFRDAGIRAAAWLERIGIAHLRDEPVRTLSRGERQKVAIVRSLLHDPDLWVWDEPSAGLDETARALLSEIISGRKSGRTVLCATHDPEQPWADRRISLEKGTLR